MLKFLLLTLVLLLLANPADAYLDPGTGSMILQMVLGGIAGAAMVARLYWRRIRKVLGFRDAEEEGAAAEAEAAEQNGR